LPGGPVGPTSRWAAASNVEVGKTTYPVNYRGTEEEGTKLQMGGEERGLEQGKEPGFLSKKAGREGSILFRIPEFLVTPQPMGSVCLLSQGR